MATLMRVKARWSGFSGAPGYSIFHFGTGANGEGGGALADDAAATDIAAAVHVFFTSIRGTLPNSVSIIVEPEVELIESTNGELFGYATAPTQATITGAGGLEFAAPAGAVVNWRTAGIRRGRRIRGKTFLVPLAAASYQSDGTLLPTYRDFFTNAAAALVAEVGSWKLGVFGRPSTDVAVDGVWAVATSSNVPDMTAILTSRRD